MEQHRMNVRALNKLCVVCGREFGPERQSHCTPGSLVAVRRDPTGQAQPRYFSLDGLELGASELRFLKEVETAQFDENRRAAAATSPPPAAPAVRPAAPAQKPAKKTGPAQIIALIFIALVGLVCGFSAMNRFLSPEAPAAIGKEAQQPEPAHDAQVPEGYALYHGDGVQIALPVSFFGGSPSADYDFLAENIRQYGPGHENILSEVEKNRDQFAFMGFDRNKGPIGDVINVNIGVQATTPGETIQTDLDGMQEYLPQMCPTCAFESSKTMTINGYEGGRMTVINAMQGMTVKSVIYLVHVKQGLLDNQMWTVTFTAGSSSYPSYEQVFEKSIQTFDVE